MKILLCLILITLLFSSFTFARTLPELEKVKEIKLLESTKDDVRKILADYKLEKNDSYQHRDTFTSKSFNIDVTYSEGRCKDEESREWDVDEWKAERIELTPKPELKLSDLGFNLSKFKKENIFTDSAQPVIYHRKQLGFVIETTGNKVDHIFYTPPQKYYLKMCDKELAKRLLSTTSYFDPQQERRATINCIFPTVNDVILKPSELHECKNDSERLNCPKSIRGVFHVKTLTNSSGLDILTFEYEVTGGKIIGLNGKIISLSDEVLWDLSNVPTGMYSISASVDNGCGFCGKTVTKTVVVKECSDCKQP